RHDPFAVLPRRPRDLEAVADVPAHRAPRQDRELLEHHAAIAAGAAYRLAVAFDRSLGGADEAGDGLEQRSLAAAARTHQRHELARADREVHGIGRLNGPVGGLEEMPEFRDDDFFGGHREPALVPSPLFSEATFPEMEVRSWRFIMH